MNPRSLLPLFALLLSCPKPDDTGDTDTGDTIDNEWGFDMKMPLERTLDCAGTPQAFLDANWLCTFDYGGTTGMVYAAATPVSCIETMSYIPTFEAVGQIWIDGTVTDLDNVAYDWGGNHHNDQVDLDWNGQHYTYSHSSFGFGWRSCQNMDCLVVTTLDGTSVQDGCGCDRSLPIVCVEVQADGSWAELADTFERCNGDDCGA